MCNIVILAKDATQVATAEENRTRAIVTLKTGLFAEMGSNCRDLDGFGPYQTMPCALISIDIAEAWAEVALPQMSVGSRSLLRCVDRGYQVVSRYVIVQEKWRSKMKGASARRFKQGLTKEMRR